jgi:hypothetical protein
VVLPASPIPSVSVKTTWRGDREADGGKHDPGGGEAAERLGRDREDVAARHRLPLEIAGGVGLRPLHDGRLLGPVYLVRVVCHRSVRVGI